MLYSFIVKFQLCVEMLNYQDDIRINAMTLVSLVQFDRLSSNMVILYFDGEYVHNGFLLLACQLCLSVFFASFGLRSDVPVKGI